MQIRIGGTYRAAVLAAFSIVGEKQVGFTLNFTEGARRVPAVAVDADRDDHRDRDDAPVLANF
jgi:hypothetical protein